MNLVCIASDACVTDGVRQPVMSMTVKKKLVKSYGSDCPDSQLLPKEYANARLRWLGCVRVESDSGWVDEYEIEPDRKLYLDDFLTLIAAEIEELDEVDDADWRVDIYKLTRRR